MRWRKENSVSWNGGTLTAAYGNLVQTWSLLTNNMVGENAVDVNRASYSAQRRNKYTDTPKSVSVPAATYTRYPRRNSSLAAGGEVVTVQTDVGSYTARLTGEIQDFVKFLIDNRSGLFGPIWVYSDRGAEYGPFNPDNPLVIGDE